MRTLCFGEMLLRLSPADHLRIEQASAFDARYGGAEANVALSLALQGDDAAYLSVIPANRIGDCAVRSLAMWGVDTSRVIRSGDRLGVYFMEFGASERPNAVVYDRKYSAISLATPDQYDWDAILDGIDLLYFSGVTPALGESCVEALLDGLKACRKMLEAAKKGERNGYLLEGMACPGGCIGGAGTVQLIPKAAQEVEKVKKMSAKAHAYESTYTSVLPDLEE